MAIPLLMEDNIKEKANKSNDQKIVLLCLCIMDEGTEAVLGGVKATPAWRGTPLVYHGSRTLPVLPSGTSMTFLMENIG